MTEECLVITVQCDVPLNKFINTYVQDCRYGLGVGIHLLTWEQATTLCAALTIAT